MNNEFETGIKCHNLITNLYPICRSITGNGVRETLKIISSHIPLEIKTIKSGTNVFDWTIPLEWNINDAYLLNTNNKKVIDFNESNLHVLNYSAPFRGTVTLEDLKKHIFTLPDYPDWIPYRTSYYHSNWGFCMRHNDFLNLNSDKYEVLINSTLEEGYLTYGEYLIPGKTDNEILISTHICHPSLCNDNLSGISVATLLAKHLSSLSNYFSYRFLFIPATIGSISWLYFNKEKTNKIKHGLVATSLGDSGKFIYKKSRMGNATIDKVVNYVLKSSDFDYEIREFMPFGYDERQYCSPGFNLPVGCLTRTPYGEYPEHHTSADNLELVTPISLQQSFNIYLQVFDVLENNRKYINLYPHCEPQLGKRGLYQKISGENVSDSKNHQLVLLWLLNQSDGSNNLIDISEKSGIKFNDLKKASELLVENGLLSEMNAKDRKKQINKSKTEKLGFTNLNRNK